MNQLARNMTTASWDNASDAMTTTNGSSEAGRNRIVTGPRHMAMAMQVYDNCTFVIGSVGSLDFCLICQSDHRL